MMPSTSASHVEHVADGNSVEFNFHFAIFQSEDLQVFLNGSLQADGFTIRGGYPSDGGTVVFQQAPAADTVLTLQRRLSIERASDFQPSGALVANTLNGEFDRLVAMVQQVDENTSRAVRAGPTDADANLLLPAREARAGRILGFDEAGDVTTLTPSLPEIINLDAIPEGADSKHFTSAEKAKLATVEPQSEANPPQVTAEEKANGSELSLRSFSPRDIVDMARTSELAGAVSSAFGRTGAVGARTGDYTAAQITDTANKVMMTAAERGKLAGFVTVTEFGAVGDGVADDAFQAALSLGKEVYVPAGTYRCGSSITVSGRPVCLLGASVNSSKIVFGGPSQGFKITLTTLQHYTRIENLSIETATAYDPGKTAILIDGSAFPTDPPAGSQPLYYATKLIPDRSTPSLHLRNLEIAGVTTAYAWGRRIDVVSLGFWVIDNIICVGTQGVDGLFKGTGLVIRGYGIPVAMCITRAQMHLLQYAILIPDTLKACSFLIPTSSGARMVCSRATYRA